MKIEKGRCNFAFWVCIGAFVSSLVLGNSDDARCFIIAALILHGLSGIEKNG